MPASAPADLTDLILVKRKYRRGFKQAIFALRSRDRMLSRYEHATSQKPDQLIPIPDASTLEASADDATLLLTTPSKKLLLKFDPNEPAVMVAWQEALANLCGKFPFVVIFGGEAVRAHARARSPMCVCVADLFLKLTQRSLTTLPAHCSIVGGDANELPTFDEAVAADGRTTDYAHPAIDTADIRDFLRTRRADDLDPTDLAGAVAIAGVMFLVDGVAVLASSL